MAFVCHLQYLSRGVLPSGNGGWHETLACVQRRRWPRATTTAPPTPGLPSTCPANQHFLLKTNERISTANLSTQHNDATQAKPEWQQNQKLGNHMHNENTQYKKCNNCSVNSASQTVHLPRYNFSHRDVLLEKDSTFRTEKHRIV